MKGIAKYIKPYTFFIILTVVIKTVASLTELFIPHMLEKIIDDAVPSGDRKRIFVYGGMMLVFALICLVTNFVANTMSAISSGKITRAVRRDLFKKLSHLSSAELDRLTIPSAVSRLTSDTYNINQMLSRIQKMGIRGPIMLIGGIVITLLMEPVLSLVLIFTLPIISFVVIKVTKKSVPLYQESQAELDNMVSTLRENITGVRVIKALGKSEYEKERFNRVNRRLYNVDTRVGGVMALTNPVTSAVLNIGLALVVLVGAFRVNSGEIRIGVIIAFLNYFTIILHAMLGVTRIFIMWSKGEASAKRISEVLAMQGGLSVIEMPDSENEDAHIEFRNVTFSYNKVKNNLHNVSFKLGRGQTLGIIGATGSGKSTLINLLLRSYDVDSGEIYIGKKNIKTMEPDALRGLFGVVFQNDFIMADTISENIRYFRDVDEMSITRAAKVACADEFIENYLEKYDHVLSQRGNDISGGQKQRLLIARALAKDPDILILDDASSALDYATDARFRRALRENYRDTTSVIVTQRISSIMHADVVLMLDDGCVIGMGTHEQLLESCDKYREIAEVQLSAMGGAANG